LAGPCVETGFARLCLEHASALAFPILRFAPALVLLRYRVIRTGNPFDVTSLFQLVPGMTAAIGYLFASNRRAASSLLGLARVLRSSQG